MDKLQAREYAAELWMAHRDSEDFKKLIEYFLRHRWTDKEQLAVVIEEISNELSMLKARYERLRMLEAGWSRWGE